MAATVRTVRIEGAGQEIEAGDSRVFAATPETVDVVDVSGCELVQLVFVQALGLAASCEGVRGSFSLTSWFPDSQRLYDLTTATLEAGGATVQQKAGGVVVTGGGSERGAEGATVNRNDTPQEAEFLEGVGAIALAGSTDLTSRARTLIGGTARVIRVVRADAGELQELAEVSGLDVTVTELSGKSAVRGRPEDVELLSEVAAGRQWVAHVVPELAGDGQTEDWVSEAFGVDVTTVAGRTIVQGFAPDVLPAIRALGQMGLHRRGRAVDIALIYGTRSDLTDAGIVVEASVGGGSAVVSAGGRAVPGIAATVHALQSSSAVHIEERPSLSVSDGQPAKVQVGQDVPVQIAMTEDGPTFEYRQTGTVLTVQTEPAAGGLVTVSVQLEVSTVDGEGVGGNPIVSRRTYDAVLTVHPGRAYLVAGLETVAETAQNSRNLWIGGGRQRQGARGTLNVLLEVR